MSMIARFGAALVRHRIALAVALAIAAVYGSHHFLISRMLSREGRAYHPVTLGSNRDEGGFYAPRGRAAYLGQWKAGDIAIAGNEQSPSLLPLLNPVLLGGLGRAFGSFERGLIASDFIFPPLIFLAIYALAYEAVHRRRGALVFASLFLISPKVFLSIPPVTPSLWHEFWSSLVPDGTNQLYFSRFEYPKLTFFFFAIALYLVLRVIRRREQWVPYAAGIAFGTLFYTYLYDWVYIAIALVFLGAFFLVRRQFADAKRIGIMLATGFLVSIGYWQNFFELRNFPHYGDLVERIGVEFGHAFRTATAWKTYVRTAALVALLCVAFRRRAPRVGAYAIAFLIPIAAVLNIQVLTGFNPQPDHWHRVQFLPVALGFLLLGSVAYGRFSARARQALRTAAYAGAIFIAGAGLGSQVAWSRGNAFRYAVDPAYRESYLWLGTHTERGSVVGSISPLTSAEVSLYTHNKVFLPNGANTTVSDREIMNRAMAMAQLYGLSVEELVALLKENVLYFFHDTYRDHSFDSYFSNAGSRTIPEGEYRELMNSYRMALDTPTEIPHQLDYLYMGSRESALEGYAPADATARFEIVYTGGSIAIYKAKKR